MKHFYAILPIALIFLASCAPGTSGTTDPDTSFNASVNGQSVPYSDGSWTYQAADYTLSFDLPAYSNDVGLVLDPRASPGVDYINVAVTNSGDTPLQVIWNESSIVFPSGDTSQVINGETRFINADQGAAPSFIPPSGRLDDLALPASNVFFLDEYQVSPIYDVRYARSATFRLFLTLDRSGERQSVDIVFTPKASQ